MVHVRGSIVVVNVDAVVDTSLSSEIICDISLSWAFLI